MPNMKTTHHNHRNEIKSVPKDVNVVNLILIDHSYFKECIKVLSDKDADKKQKLFQARGFLDALEKHSKAEKLTIYKHLINEESLHASILEGEIEHEIVDEKVKLLKPKVHKSRTLSEELEAELKVLAELVQHHVKEEESEMLPTMKRDVDEERLCELGTQFMKVRKFATEDLEKSFQLQNELLGWKESMQNLSQQFITKVDKYIESLGA